MRILKSITVLASVIMLFSCGKQYDDIYSHPGQVLLINHSGHDLCLNYLDTAVSLKDRETKYLLNSQWIIRGADTIYHDTVEIAFDDGKRCLHTGVREYRYNTITNLSPEIHNIVDINKYVLFYDIRKSTFVISYTITEYEYQSAH